MEERRSRGGQRPAASSRVSERRRRRRGRAHRVHGRRAARRPATHRRSLECRRGQRAHRLRRAVAVREDCRTHAQQPQRRDAHVTRPNPSPPAERHGHPQRPALRHFALGQPRHRSRPAPSRDSRAREPAARLHARCAQRYPMVSRMAFLECGGNSAPLFSNEPIAGQRAGAPRPRVLRRVDGRDALHAARRSRHRPEGQVARRRRRRLARARAAASRSPRRSTTR